MRISFQSWLLRFTLTSGADDAAEYEEAGEPDEYLQMVEGSFELSPTQADYEDATYVPDWEDDDHAGPDGFGFRPVTGSIRPAKRSKYPA